MKLREMKSIIDQASKKAGKADVDVEVWMGDVQLRIESVGQFGVVNDVVIHLEPLDKLAKKKR